MPALGKHKLSRYAGENYDESQFLVAALERHKGNVSRAARSLGMVRSGFWYHLRRLGLGDLPRQIRARKKKELEFPSWDELKSTA